MEIHPSSQLNSSQNMEFHFSEFQLTRQKYQPKKAKIFQSNEIIKFKESNVNISEAIASLFPTLTKQTPSYVELLSEGQRTNKLQNSPLRIAVVLSGGQAAGGHNVISGVFDFVKSFSSHSQLFGFLGGPEGIYKGKVIEIDEKLMEKYRNQGGFDMICSGRHKIETQEQFADSLKHCMNLKLDGLIVIGGDDSNTNACLLAEYFKKNDCPVKVIGVPKTIDGDLKNQWIEVSFGFDTATRVYSEEIGNICLDTFSSKKYYHFIRLMGRSASHIALECALLTQINIVLIGEEVEAKKQTLKDIVKYLADVICQRAINHMNYGVVLVPEGLIEFIPEVNVLIKEINEIVSKPFEGEIREYVIKNLSDNSRDLFIFLPRAISEQLLLDRDPHGNVQVAKIDTERLLVLLLATELTKRMYQGVYKGKFSPICHYFGYEGRCALPSCFDTEYCYNLGFNAGQLISLGFTGYMSVIRNLHLPNPEDWVPAGCPLVCMMNVERRKGKNVPVIKKALVELEGDLFKYYEIVRDTLSLNDSYIIPGPIQFYGESAISCPFLVKPPSLENINLEAFKVAWKGSNAPYSAKSIDNLSRLSRLMIKENVPLPRILREGNYQLKLSSILEPFTEESKQAGKKFYPKIFSNVNHKYLAEIVDSYSSKLLDDEKLLTFEKKDLRIGVVYCGRQSPGGNNIIDGLLEFKQQMKGKGIKVTVIGFIYGTKGLFKADHIEITHENFYLHKNHGGYDFLGRSADKIRSHDELQATRNTCINLNLDSLILVGATHTMTDSLLLTEYFDEHNIKTCIISIPSTVDGNVKHPLFEMTIGFDTASKVYSQLIGNSMTDAASATKYWYLMRLMGRDPSFLVLECALQTHPNYVIISEESASKGQSLDDIVSDICDVIVERAKQKKNFGTILIPEGLLSHLPHYKTLIDELNVFFSKHNTDDNTINNLLYNESYLKEVLSPWSSAVFLDLPEFTKKQLLLEREVHGGIQLSQIETERLLSYKISKELEKRKKNNTYSGSFAAITHFFGYQGRCSFPSFFDMQLATTYGFIAGVLSQYQVSGYCVTARGLTGPEDEWKCAGIPLIAMTSVKGKSQYGENRPVITSGYVDMNEPAFLELKARRKEWVLENKYCNPGPIQLFNNSKFDINKSLKINHENYNLLLRKIEGYCDKIKSTCRFGAHEDTLSAAVYGLEAINKILGIIKKH